MLEHIAWVQVIVAFILGVIFSAMVKGLFGGLKSKLPGTGTAGG